MKLLMSNKTIFLLLNFILYVFYGVLVGVCLIPSALLVISAYYHAPELTIIKACVAAIALGIGIFLFFITGLIVFGITERLLTLGFKPGKYSKDSPVFVRWIVYSGVHTIALSLILPFVLGSGFSQIYYKLIGCKFGKDVFINSVGLHDAYLLELGDNVVIGGKSDITCHTFEGDSLTLGKVKIGNNVLIGANCYIMPGVTIGDNCDIGANSVIRKNKEIKGNSIIMPIPGLPAKQAAKLLNITKRYTLRDEISTQDGKNC